MLFLVPDEDWQLFSRNIGQIYYQPPTVRLALPSISSVSKASPDTGEYLIRVTHFLRNLITRSTKDPWGPSLVCRCGFAFKNVSDVKN